jgi:F0F1-type ATP synthase assembly protein I
MPPTTDAVARATSSSRRDLWTGVDHASVMGVELMAAILTWTGVGWLVDRWLGTAPWFLVAGGLIGNAAGLYLIWLRSGRMNDVEERRSQEARRAA